MNEESEYVIIMLIQDSTGIWVFGTGRVNGFPELALYRRRGKLLTWPRNRDGHTMFAMLAASNIAWCFVRMVILTNI